MITIETCAMDEIFSFDTFELADRFLITLLDKKSSKLNLVFESREDAQNLILQINKELGNE